MLPVPMDLQQSHAKKLSLPMYKPCHVKKTSAEIIREARETIVKGHSDPKMLPDHIMASVKPVNTQRPFTPKDNQRILFGRNSKAARPPSSFSLRYLQFENPEHGPSSLTNTNNGNATDIDVFNANKSTSRRNSSEIFKVPTQDIPITKIKLPSIESCFKPFNKFVFRSTNSLEKLPEEHENLTETPRPVRRNAYSSPNESTSIGRLADSNKRSHQSDHLILEPRNLDNIFPNKQIIYDSGNLFGKRKFHMNGNTTETSFISRTESGSTLNNLDSVFSGTAEVLQSLDDNFLDCEQLLKRLHRLYANLKADGYIDGGKKVGSKLKLNILKTLYKFVESNNEKVLLHIARIILAIRVTGSNLAGVCKLVFKISRDDKNDPLFTENNTLDLFLEALGSASPIEDTEALIYGYGAIKFLTMNTELLKTILNQGTLQLMVLHIKIINNARIEKVQTPEQTSHVLFQLTGALRNLASDERIFDEFVTSGAISVLCQSMELFIADVDVISNISRTLSIISTDERCCENIVEFDNIFVVFATLLDKYPGKQDMAVRLGYTMGNLVAKFDSARYKFYNARNSMGSLLNVIDVYVDKDSKSSLVQDDRRVSIENSREVGGSTGSIEDVIVKMIRITANIAINGDVGNELVTNYGEKLIDILLVLLTRKAVPESEELILSILSTLNNLSYYYTPDQVTNGFHKKQLDLCTELCKIIQTKNKECITESIRVLGNLTRSKTSRDYILESGSFSTLIKLVDSDNDMDLLKTTIGVFINMMADEETRVKFKNEKGVTKIIKALAQFGEMDWPLSTLICQVIWNYSIDSSNLCHLIDEFDVNQLLGILVDYLDEERIFGITEETTSDISDVLSSEEYILWEEFATVGTNLLEKIEYYLDKISVEQMEFNTDSSDDNDVYTPLELTKN